MGKRQTSKQAPKAPKRATRSTFRRTRTGRIIDSTPVSLGKVCGRKSHPVSEGGISTPAELLVDRSSDKPMMSRVDPMKGGVMVERPKGRGIPSANPENSVRPGGGVNVSAGGRPSGLSHGTTSILPSISKNNKAPRAIAIVENTVDVENTDEEQSADSAITSKDANIVEGKRTSQIYVVGSRNASTAKNIICGTGIRRIQGLLRTQANDQHHLGSGKMIQNCTAVSENSTIGAEELSRLSIDKYATAIVNDEKNVSSADRDQKTASSSAVAAVGRANEGLASGQDCATLSPFKTIGMKTLDSRGICQNRLTLSTDKTASAKKMGGDESGRNRPPPPASMAMNVTNRGSWATWKSSESADIAVKSMKSGSKEKCPSTTQPVKAIDKKTLHAGASTTKATDATNSTICQNNANLSAARATGAKNAIDGAVFRSHTSSSTATSIASKISGGLTSTEMHTASSLSAAVSGGTNKYSSTARQINASLSSATVIDKNSTYGSATLQNHLTPPIKASALKTVGVEGSRESHSATPPSRFAAATDAKIECDGALSCASLSAATVIGKKITGLGASIKNHGLTSSSLLSTATAVTDATNNRFEDQSCTTFSSATTIGANSVSGGVIQNHATPLVQGISVKNTGGDAESSSAAATCAKNREGMATARIHSTSPTATYLRAEAAGGWDFSEGHTASLLSAAVTDASDCKAIGQSNASLSAAAAIDRQSIGSKTKGRSQAALLTTAIGVKIVDEGATIKVHSATSAPLSVAVTEATNRSNGKAFVKGSTSEHAILSAAVNDTEDGGGTVMIECVALAPGKRYEESKNAYELVAAESCVAASPAISDRVYPSSLKAKARTNGVSKMVDENASNPKKRPNPFVGNTACYSPNFSIIKAKELAAGDANKTNEELHHNYSSVNETNQEMICPFETPKTEHQFRPKTTILLHDAITRVCEPSTNKTTDSNGNDNRTLSNQILTHTLRRSLGVSSETLKIHSTSNLNAEDNNSSSSSNLSNKESSVINQDTHTQEYDTITMSRDKIMPPPNNKDFRLFDLRTAGMNRLSDSNMNKNNSNFHSSEKPIAGQRSSKIDKIDCLISATALSIISASPVENASKISASSQANSRNSYSNIRNSNLTPFVHGQTTRIQSASKTKHSNGDDNLTTSEGDLKYVTNNCDGIHQSFPHSPLDSCIQYGNTDSFSSHRGTSGSSKRKYSDASSDKNETSINENSTPSANDNRTHTSEMQRNPSTPDSNTQDSEIDSFSSHQLRIETIARKEALRHVEMAWRAQQRLVQRCLALQLQRSSPKAISRHQKKRDT